MAEEAPTGELARLAACIPHSIPEAVGAIASDALGLEAAEVTS